MYRALLYGAWASPADALDPSELINFAICEFLWWGILVNRLTSIVSHSQFGKRPVARDIIVLGTRGYSTILEPCEYPTIVGTRGHPTILETRGYPRILGTRGYPTL